MRPSTLYIVCSAAGLLLFVLMILHADAARLSAQASQQEHAAMVKTLQLTDLCLFTEARYTRHPAMADRFAPFQDHPAALEHFPSGSLVAPPVIRSYANKP